MIKNCENCHEDFKTKDSRQKSCSKVCADISRRAWKPNAKYNANVRTGRMRSDVPNLSAGPKYDLPPPEELPAPYAKRVHDMWATLTGGDAPTRIA